MNPYVFKNMVWGQGGKQIKVNCNICGKEQWLSLNSYNKVYLCHHCSTHTSKFINKMINNMINNNPMKNQKTKDKNGESQKKYYEDHPEAREQRREDGKRSHDDPIKEAKRIIKLKEHYSGSIIRENIKNKQLEWWCNHPEEKIAQSIRATNQIHSPRSEESKKRYSESKKGNKNPMWKGGLSSSSYCHLFNLPLKEAIRLYFDNKCFMNNEPEKDNKTLSVHHVNYDKRCGCDATQFCIFVPVTRSWNTIFNGNKEHNRWYWYSLLMNKIFIEHPNYFIYHIPVWGMNELEYNYEYVFEKFRRK
jgi:hypothetical protein